MTAFKNSYTWLTLAVVLAAGFGCQTTIAPGADPVVVRAEQTAERALDVFDSFLKWEARNWKVVGRDVNDLADSIRQHGKQWIADLRAATVAYQNAKTGDNLDRLMFAQGLIEIALADIREQKARGDARPTNDKARSEARPTP